MHVIIINFFKTVSLIRPGLMEQTNANWGRKKVLLWQWVTIGPRAINLCALIIYMYVDGRGHRI